MIPSPVLASAGEGDQQKADKTVKMPDQEGTNINRSPDHWNQ